MTADDLVADILDGLRSQLPGADDGIILYTLRDCLRDLCRYGRVWRIERTIPAIRNLGVLRTGTVSGFGELVWLEAVTFNGVPLGYRHLQLCRDQPKPGSPAWYAFEAPDKIYVNPILQEPEPGDQFCVHAALQPRLGDEPAKAVGYVPVHVLDRFAEQLKEGVMGRMLAMPAKPWSNTKLAVAYLNAWSGHRSKARVESRTDFGANPRPQWRYPNAAARRV